MKNSNEYNSRVSHRIKVKLQSPNFKIIFRNTRIQRNQTNKGRCNWVVVSPSKPEKSFSDSHEKIHWTRPREEKKLRINMTGTFAEILCSTSSAERSARFSTPPRCFVRDTSTESTLCSLSFRRPIYFSNFPAGIRICPSSYPLDYLNSSWWPWRGFDPPAAKKTSVISLHHFPR